MDFELLRNTPTWSRKRRRPRLGGGLDKALSGTARASSNSVLCEDTVGRTPNLVTYELWRFPTVCHSYHVVPSERRFFKAKMNVCELIINVMKQPRKVDTFSYISRNSTCTIDKTTTQTSPLYDDIWEGEVRTIGWKLKCRHCKRIFLWLG